MYRSVFDVIIGKEKRLHFTRSKQGHFTAYVYKIVVSLTKVVLRRICGVNRTCGTERKGVKKSELCTYVRLSWVRIGYVTEAGY